MHEIKKVINLTEMTKQKQVWISNFFSMYFQMKLQKRMIM